MPEKRTRHEATLFCESVYGFIGFAVSALASCRLYAGGTVFHLLAPFHISAFQIQSNRVLMSNSESSTLKMFIEK